MTIPKQTKGFSLLGIIAPYGVVCAKYKVVLTKIGAT
jgi:hypothetical protein